MPTEPGPTSTRAKRVFPLDDSGTGSHVDQRQENRSEEDTGKIPREVRDRYPWDLKSFFSDRSSDRTNPYMSWRPVPVPSIVSDAPCAILF